MRPLLFGLVMLLSGCCCNPSTLISLLPFFIRPESDPVERDDSPPPFKPFCGLPRIK